jgi:UDP-N-acetyl-D-glucosamine dehydrogenase
MELEKMIEKNLTDSLEKLTVVGMGYVGAPLAYLACNKGYEVYSVDINQKRIDEIKVEVDYKRLKNKFHISADMEATDIYVICVPTPIDSLKQPDLSLISDALATVSRVMEDGALIIIESTIYPGMCEDVIMPILDMSDKKYYLAHCPERINPGDEKWDVSNIDRIIGAIDNDSLIRACRFYESILDAKINKVSGIKVAEAVKLFENIFRDVNIALVNEMAKAFEKLSINVVEVIEAAATKPFGFLPHWPGVGVGGHCIAVDPYYMIESGRAVGFDYEFLKLARKINSSMPIYAVDLLQYSLNKLGKTLVGAKVLVYGLAYKPELSDTRESPSYEVINNLIHKKLSDVKLYDPFVVKESNFLSIEDALNWAEILVICTAHQEILNLEANDFKKLEFIFDGRNCLDLKKIKASGNNYQGIGRMCL